MFIAFIRLGLVVVFINTTKYQWLSPIRAHTMAGTG